MKRKLLQFYLFFKIVPTSYSWKWSADYRPYAKGIRETSTFNFASLFKSYFSFGEKNDRGGILLGVPSYQLVGSPVPISTTNRSLHPYFAN